MGRYVEASAQHTGQTFRAVDIDFHSLAIQAPQSKYEAEAVGNQEGIACTQGQGHSLESVVVHAVPATNAK